MYAVIEVGGKQQLVKKGDKVLVEKQEALEGASITFDKVLLAAEGEKIMVGQPFVKGASVEAKVLKQTKGPKTVAFKYRRRKSSHTKKGHRQQLTELEIVAVKA